MGVTLDRGTQLCTKHDHFNKSRTVASATWVCRASAPSFFIFRAIHALALSSRFESSWFHHLIMVSLTYLENQSYRTKKTKITTFAKIFRQTPEFGENWTLLALTPELSKSKIARLTKDTEEHIPNPFTLERHAMIVWRFGKSLQAGPTSWQISGNLTPNCAKENQVLK